MYKRLEKSSSEDAEVHCTRSCQFGRSVSARCFTRFRQGFKHVIILSDLQTFEHNGHLSQQLRFVRSLVC